MKRFLLFLFLLVSIISMAQNDLSDKEVYQKTVVKNNQGVPPANGIRIRGATTLSNGIKPLFVIDGEITEDITEINPDDIETVSVLKDDALSKMVSCRSQHSVIMITTKSKNRNRIKVVDVETGEAIANASVKFIADDKHFLLFADSAGTVFLDKEKAGVNRIEITSVGYELTKEKIDFSKQRRIVLKMKRSENKLGEVVISSSIHRRGCRMWCRAHRIYVDSTFALNANKTNFLTYPNPVSKGQVLTVVPQETINGQYSITSIAGQVVRSGKINANPEQPIQINTANLSAGTYLIRLTGEARAQSITQKFIVQ